MSHHDKKRRGLVWIISIAAALAFLAGYMISVIAGIWWPDNSGIIATLAVLGLVVGIFNITTREIIPYLVAAIALVLIGTAQPFTPLDDVWDGLGRRSNDIVGLMAIFTAPAAVIQAIRAGISLARPGDE